MITFIDANCMVGQRNVCREGSPVTPSDYMEIMNRCGIEKAIVYHCMTKENDILTGNNCVDKDLSGNELFIKQWGVMPNNTGEFIPEDTLLSEMKKHNVHTVRMFPAIQDYSLKPYASGKLIRTLAEANVPIFIEKSQLSWEDVYALCTAYPESKFVLCDTGYRCLRHLIPIMEACDNLFIETSTYLMHNGVRDFCHRFGAERMIFGTGMPDHSTTAATSLIRYADISTEEKMKIASGNILRLLSEVTL